MDEREPDEPDREPRAASGSHASDPRASSDDGDALSRAGSASGAERAHVPSRPPVARPRGVVGARGIVVTRVLIGLNVAWFAWMALHGVSLVSPTSDELLRFGADFGPSIAGGDWWRPLTAAFVHIGFIHLGMNMWALWVLGPPTERVFGNGAFALLYVFGALGASALSVLLHPAVFSAGASGAVFACAGALLGFLLLHRRDLPVEAFRPLVRNLLTVIGLNLVLGASVPGIDNAGHVGGLLAGLASAWCLDRRPDVVPRLGLRRIAPAVVLALVLLGLLALIPASVARSPGASTRLGLVRSEEAEERGDLESAERHATEALQLQPSSTEALARRADLRLRLGRPREAIADADTGLKAHPDAVDLRFIRALARIEVADFEQARTDLESIEADRPAVPGVHAELGRVALALGDWKSAVQSFETAARLERTVAIDVHLGLWLARVELGLFDQADRALRERAAGSQKLRSDPTDLDPADLDLVHLALGELGADALDRLATGEHGEWARLLASERAFRQRTRDPRSLDVPMRWLDLDRRPMEDPVLASVAHGLHERARDEVRRRLMR